MQKTQKTTQKPTKTSSTPVQKLTHGLKSLPKVSAVVLAFIAPLLISLTPVITKTTPAFAAKDNSSSESSDKDSNCVKTSILGGNDGEYCDDGEGGGVYDILSIVLNVLTIGVGVLGVLGITISGIQYATAADNEQQMAKAKQRIIEVVIGLAIYAVMYGVLQWLIPGGIFGDTN